MTNRSTFESDVKSAELTKAATIQTAVNTLQETIAAVADNAGTPLANGTSAANALTIKNAQATYNATVLKAEHDRQQTVANSRAKNLQANGDVLPT